MRVLLPSSGRYVAFFRRTASARHRHHVVEDMSAHRTSTTKGPRHHPLHIFVVAVGLSDKPLRKVAHQLVGGITVAGSGLQAAANWDKTSSGRWYLACSSHHHWNREYPNGLSDSHRLNRSSTGIGSCACVCGGAEETTASCPGRVRKWPRSRQCLSRALAAIARSGVARAPATSSSCPYQPAISQSGSAVPLPLFGGVRLLDGLAALERPALLLRRLR